MLADSIRWIFRSTTLAFETSRSHRNHRAKHKIVRMEGYIRTKAEGTDKDERRGVGRLGQNPSETIGEQAFPCRLHSISAYARCASSEIGVSRIGGTTGTYTRSTGSDCCGTVRVGINTAIVIEAREIVIATAVATAIKVIIIYNMLKLLL